MENSVPPKKYTDVSPKERFAYLAALVSASSKEISVNDPLNLPLNTEEVATMRRVVGADYKKWLTVLGLRAVPLDVYGFDNESDENTEMGTPIKHGLPGYNGERIVLPLVPEITRNDGMVAPEFPPSKWDGKLPAWPTWRIDLFHEVVHLVEHQTLCLWNKTENLETYGKAIDKAVETFKGFGDVSSDEIQMLTNGFKERKLPRAKE